MALVLSVLEQGMIYAIMALGVYITYKILDFPDLTVDGQLPTGGCHYGCYDHQRSSSIDHIGGVLCSRSSRRSSDRSHPCQIKGAGSVVGNHYDDRIVYRQFKDSRTCKPADLIQKKQYLITIWSTAFLKETQHSFQPLSLFLSLP